MNRVTVTIPFLDGDIERWSHGSCVADFGLGVSSDGPWATLYSIKSAEPGNGHATELLRAAKEHYERTGMTFGGSVALNPRMRAIYQRLDIREYA